MNKILLTCYALLLISACQPTLTDAPVQLLTQDIETTIEVSANRNEFIVWGISELTEDIDLYMERIFEEAHPEIDVVFVDAGWDEALRQNFENSIQMGRPPEIVIGENYFRSFAANGHIQAVDSVLNNYDDVISATYAAAEYEGSIYAVPYLTGIFAFERNCSVIEAVNLDCDSPPQYWDELLEEARIITEAGLGDYYGYTLQGPGGTAVGSAFRVAVYQAQLDALPCVDDACAIPDFNRAESRPVYEFLREIVNYAPPGLVNNTHEGEVYEALFRGISAYQVAGSWHPQWAQSAGCNDCRYSSIPRPRDGNTSNLLVGNVLYAAPSNSQHPDLALEWLELLLSDDIQSRVFAQSGRLPVRRSILEDLEPTVDSATGVFIGEMLGSTDLRILPQWENRPRDVWQIYNDLLGAVFTTTRPIETLMSEAQEALDEIQN